MQDDSNRPINTAPTPPLSQNTPKKKVDMKMWLVLLIGLVAGAAIVGVIWLYWPKVASAPTSTTPTTSAVTTTPATTTAVANCTLDDLSMSVGSADGAAGTVYQHMVFTNKSSKTCTLAGYPTVFLLDATNTILGDGAKPAPSPVPTTLTLAAGAKAYTAVGFPQAGNFSPGICSANSVTIRVFIPGTASYLESALAKPNCPGFSASAFATGS